MIRVSLANLTVETDDVKIIVMCTSCDSCRLKGLRFNSVFIEEAVTLTKEQVAALRPMVDGGFK
jgi:hypothetical protein